MIDLNFGTLAMAGVLVLWLVYLSTTGRLRRGDDMTDVQKLRGMIEVLQADHIRDSQEIEKLRRELAEAWTRIRELEARLNPDAPRYNVPQVGGAPLAKIIEGAFSLEELAALADDVCVPLDSIPGETLPAKALGLVQYCERRSATGALRDAVRRARPNLMV